MSKSSVKGNFLDSLLAVVAGNAIYALIQPWLPGVARHRMFQEDTGLAVDFLICATLFGLLRWWRWRGESRSSR